MKIYIQIYWKIFSDNYEWAFASTLHEKCPTDLLRKYPYSVRIRENKDQKKLRTWTLFTQTHIAN